MFFMGLGDVIMPVVLVASAFHNIARNVLLIALSVMLGTLFGFTVLMTAPYQLVSSYILFGELVGLTLPI